MRPAQPAPALSDYPPNGKINALIGHTNAEPFAGRPAGTLRFAGQEVDTTAHRRRLLFVYLPEGWEFPLYPRGDLTPPFLTAALPG